MTKLISVLLFLPLLVTAQPNLPPQIADSLWNIWQDETQPDTTRLGAMNKYIWNGYLFTQPDSAFYYSQLEYDFANSRGLKKQMADALNGQGISFAIRGNYDRAIDHFIKSLKIKEDVGDQVGVANLLNNVGIIYEDQGDYKRAIDNYLLSIEIHEELGNMKGVANSLNNIGNSYYNQNEFLKAIDYHTRSLNIKEKTGDKNGIAISLNNIGLVYNKQGEYAKALETFTRSLKIKEEFGDKQSISNTLNNIGGIYMSEGDYNSALEYSRRAFTLAKEVGAVIQTRDAANSLWKVHKKLGNYKPSLEMYELYIELRDSVLSEENEKEVIRQEYQYAYEKQAAADSVAIAKATEITNAHIAQQKAELKVKKNQQYGLFIGLVLMFILAASAYYRFQSKKKANELLQKTLADLKSTQSLLIQSEKMASLGELTAGIAHEIQNPLNFVNNFSELNSELIAELKVELANGNLSAVESIATDLSENEDKINHHGKRADSIVKGMLAHSRKSEGAKEPIDVNALADEYLRLSYHGLRAQNKSFNAEIKTDFDESLGKIDVIPEDIGRVLLNLFNNAFYAVHEKAKGEESTYDPTVSVMTKKVNHTIEIHVIDNGNGIPDKIKNKIFQPFFTTKPTGQGTGLGLSLSYDIVKAHGGELKVETEAGVGSTFIIELPLNVANNNT